jgi:hypothetical protein
MLSRSEGSSALYVENEIRIRSLLYCLHARHPAVALGEAEAVATVARGGKLRSFDK